MGSGIGERKDEEPAHRNDIAYENLHMYLVSFENESQVAQAVIKLSLLVSLTLTFYSHKSTIWVP